MKLLTPIDACEGGRQRAWSPAEVSLHFSEFEPVYTDWYEKDGVLVSHDIKPSEIKGVNVNPAVNPEADGIGQIKLHSMRPGPDSSGSSARSHFLYSIELDGFHHAVEVTNPVSRRSFTLASFPGYTETLQNRFRKQMQGSLAATYPNARIISFETDGLGSTGDRYGWDERTGHDLEQMAARRHRLLNALAGDEPLIVMGTSMGSIITHRLAEGNLHLCAGEQPLNIKGLQWLSPALVDPRNIFRDMAIEFLPQMVWDTANELALKTLPHEAAGIALSIVRYGLKRQDLTALAGHLLNLLQGTSEERVAEVVSEFPTAMVAGEKDGLAQWTMQTRLQEAFPATYRIKKIKGRGHSLGMKPGKACPSIRQAAQHLIEQALGPAHAAVRPAA